MESEPKPAAKITVWGIVLMVGGQVIGVLAAYTGLMDSLTQTAFEDGSAGPGVMMFLGGAVSLAGFIMMLVGIYRFISRTDPEPQTETAPRQVDSERNPDGTYKNAFTPAPNNERNNQ